MPLRKKPVFLNLLQIRLPIAGIMSIIHRASGMLMVLLIPLSVYLLDLSLADEQGFAAVGSLLQSSLVGFTLFLLLWALLHHLYSGIRYLLIDVEIGVERPVYRYTAWAVTLLAPLSALLLWGVL
ncbi:MAG: succinate dehydrogenase, cytochrome b556 subunit [Pseudomonadota bacterium]|nr:succinate dehydrogenase, cytochrome b556 subunit [Pseudomonadota bacterium]